MKRKKQKIIAIITVILIAIAVFFIFNNISIEKVKNGKEKYQDYTPEEEISDEQLRKTKVILYFANNETGELETEIKLIDAKTLIENPAKEIVNFLIKGPQSTNLKKLIPDGTILHDVKIEDSSAIVNVSSEFLNFESDEIKLKTINSIVNTLTNLKEIESVRFLINAEQNEKIMDTYMKNKE